MVRETIKQMSSYSNIYFCYICNTGNENSLAIRSIYNENKNLSKRTNSVDVSKYTKRISANTTAEHQQKSVLGEMPISVGKREQKHQKKKKKTLQEINPHASMNGVFCWSLVVT